MTEATFRTATLSEVAEMLDWAAAEGWNPGLEDAAAFHASDPDGFFIAEVAGKAVAAISVVNHSDDFAFLGLYLCQPAYRGQGIGFALWSHALAHAGTRTVGLDGVPAQEANYAKSGFVRTGRTRRMCGTLPFFECPAREVTPGDLPALAALDLRANGFSRLRFLAEWARPTETRRTVLLEDGTGFATARLCREGCKIGPIVAPSAEDALALAIAATSLLDQSQAIVDVPEDSAQFAQLLEDRGFQETFATARMYRGPAPKTGTTLQAIATMELG
ncbi:GNAT family N-acetyltransferase [Halovulum sp. GXIMD14794]